MTQKQPRRIVVGVSGGIAAYKACHLVRDLKEAGDDVRVVPTPSALNFVGAATFEALSGHPVSTTVFDAVDEVQHVRVGQEADAVVIAPATADVMARLVAGRADDLLTATVLVALCPVIVVPAMHTEMWWNAATQANEDRGSGRHVLEPSRPSHAGHRSGAPAGAGSDRRAGPWFSTADHAGLGGAEGTYHGRRHAESGSGALPGQPPGRQGFALAEIAAHRGAEVTIVAGATDDLPTPSGARVEKVTSAREMAEVVGKLAPEQDVIIMAAAVADFRPVSQAGAKMKKGSDDAALMNVELVENPDILATTVQQRRDGLVPAETTIVGFAAETGDEQTSALEFAQAKLVRKGCDLLMANEVGEGKVFGQARNSGWLLTTDGTVTEVPDGSKHVVAAAILNAVDELHN